MPVSIHALVIFAAFALALPNPVLNKPSLAASFELANSSACDDIHHCRTIWDIIWSCVTTVSLCTWVSYHPEVPDRESTSARIALTRIVTVFISFLIPEYVVAKAASQWSDVRRHKSRLQGWTETHSFFTIMGGFVNEGVALDFQTVKSDPSGLPAGLFTSKDSKSDRTVKSGSEAPSTPPRHSMLRQDNVSPSDIVEETKPGTYSPLSPNPPLPQLEITSTDGPKSTSEHNRSTTSKISISKADILDKSKSSGVAKFLTVSQTTWFILQFIERWAAHQARTQLEIMTVAYALLNIVIYALWWNKPLNVNEPIEVSGRRDLDAPARESGLWVHDKWLIEDALEAWVDDHGKEFDDLTIFTMSIIGVVFGGVHCFAWHFHFPTHDEEVLWRVSSVFCAGAPLVLCLILMTMSVFPEMFVKVSLVVGTLLYIVCRVILLVLTFTCLRAEPPAVFIATTWTRFLPHIG